MRKTKQAMAIFGAGLAALSMAMASGPVFAATAYNYVGTNYTTFYDNCTPPGNPTAGPSVAYSGTMHASG